MAATYRGAGASARAPGSGTSFNVAQPASTQVGDLLIAVAVTNSITSFPMNQDGSWTQQGPGDSTQQASGGGGSVALQIFTKTATSAGAANHSFACQSSFAGVTIIAVGGAGATQLGAWSLLQTGASSFTVAGITPSSSIITHGGLLFVFDVGTNTGGIDPPSGMTEAFDANTTVQGRSSEGSYVAYNSTANTGTRTITHTGSTNTSPDVGVQFLVLPANNPPTAPTVTAPNGGETVNASVNITWTAGTDPDGDALTYDIDYSLNNGGVWTNIVTGTSGTSYNWNTSAISASASCLVRVRSRDTFGGLSAYDQSNAVFTIAHNQAPNPATWASPANGTTLDRASAQTLTFNFLDPDSGDVMTSFDYRYRIVGAPTWITGSQSGSTPSLTFAANALAAGTYEVQVLTYDGQGVAATGWSASLQIVMASAPAAPVITTPASGGTIATTTGIAAWTVGTQTGYQVQQIADNAGVMADPNVPANVYSDTGQITGAGAATARNAPQTYPVNNRYEWVRVRIQNNTLWSAWTAVRYQVTYTPPAAVGVAVSAPPTVVDSLQVAVTLPAPSGSQPVVTSIELWRQRISNQAGAVIANETPVRVATTPPTAGGTTVIQDLTVASGNGYQYQAIAIGANNTVTRSPWVS